MPEYIERSKIEYPYMTMSMWGINSATCKAYNEGVKAVEDVIASLPTADVVKVVRCKDCKNRGVWKQASVKWKGKALCCSKFQRKTMPDDFCSCGELKECEG